MPNFVSIKFISSFRKVTYYSVVLDGDETEQSLFEQFIEDFTLLEKEKLNHILSWIREMGDKYGAQSTNFRDEQKAKAIPPKGTKRRPTYIVDGEEQVNNLRLYCHRLNEQVVFLFNGHIKTAKKAQDCQNVKPCFDLANVLAEKIDNAIRNGEIEWAEDFDDILYEEDYKLYF